MISLKGFLFALLISFLFWLSIGYLGLMGYRWASRDAISMEVRK